MTTSISGRTDQPPGPGTPAPSMHTGEPLNDTEIRAGSRVNGPCRRRPAPCPSSGRTASAVFTRLSRATRRAAVTASASLGAPVTETATRLRHLRRRPASGRTGRRRPGIPHRRGVPGSADLAGPEASSSTVSLVEQLPSTSSRSKVREAAAQRGIQRGGVRDRVGGHHDQHGGQRRRKHAYRLAMPPTVQFCPDSIEWCSATCLGTVSVVMMARGLVAAEQPGVDLVDDLGDAGQHPVHRQAVADEGPVEHAPPRSAPVSVPPVGQRDGDGLGACVGVLEALGTGAGIGAAGVQQHGPQSPGGECPAGPQHRGGLTWLRVNTPAAV